jgi:RHS repeat-associated protein
MPKLTTLLLALLTFSLPALPAQAGETVTYYHLDALGSPVAATDEQGNLKWREEYRPYGSRIKKQTEADNNSRWFTGHPHDEEFGLTYAGARYYDPVVGRFMGVDPIPFQENVVHSFNRYAYAANNPYKYVDPDGRENDIVNGSITDPIEAREYIDRGAFNEYPRPDFLEFELEGGIPTSAAGIGLVKTLTKSGIKNAPKEVSKVITKSSRKRVKRLIKDLSDNSRKNNGLSQKKTDQLRRIVEKAGGKLRNDGASGVKGSSARKPHVQTEGLGKSIDSRHIWTKERVQ